MTTVHAPISLQHHGTTMTTPAELSLRWSVSRPALASALRTSQLPAQPEITLALSAELTHDGLVRSVRATAAGGEIAPDLTAGAAGAWIRDEETSLLHVRISEPTSDTPLLDATLKLTGAGAEVLYARTTLLSHLRLPGGRYEVEGAAIAPRD